MFDAVAVANCIVERAKAKGIILTPMQLQKLLYFSQGWFLALWDKPIINQPIEAWKWGPVVCDVYDEFKNFGAEIITETPSSAVLGSDSAYFQPAVNLVDQIIETYGGFTGAALTAMIHKEGAPWSSVYGDGNHWHKIIDNNLIETYFNDLKTNNNIY